MEKYANMNDIFLRNEIHQKFEQLSHFLNLRPGIRTFCKNFQWQWIVSFHYKRRGTAILKDERFMPQMFYIIQ